MAATGAYLYGFVRTADAPDLGSIGLLHEGTPGRVYLGVEFDYWHNKYGIAGLTDNVVLPVVVWTF